MLFALGFIAMFVIGGLSGVMHASPPSDLQQTDTYFIVAHLHYVLFGGSLFGIFAGIYYWFPKVTGRLLNEGLGKLHFALFFIGGNLTFFPMHFLGMDGMPRRIYTYSNDLGLEWLNTMVTAGAFVISLSILIFSTMYSRRCPSLRRERRTPGTVRPWSGPFPRRPRYITSTGFPRCVAFARYGTRSILRQPSMDRRQPITKSMQATMGMAMVISTCPVRLLAHRYGDRYDDSLVRPSVFWGGYLHGAAGGRWGSHRLDKYVWLDPRAGHI